MGSFASLMVVMAVSRSASSLTISLDENARRRGIALAEESRSALDTMDSGLRTILRADPVVDAWNIDGDRDIPPDAHLEKEGSNNGEFYLLYSFFVFNSGEESVNLLFIMDTVRVTRNLDETIRVRLHIGDEDPKVYAKRNSETGLPEPGTIPFESNNSIINTIGSLEAGEELRISITIWIEGNDPDTTNDKLGGTISLEGRLEVIG